jgi:hypothetical protein
MKHYVICARTVDGRDVPIVSSNTKQAAWATYMQWAETIRTLESDYWDSQGEPTEGWALHVTDFDLDLFTTTQDATKYLLWHIMKSPGDKVQIDKQMAYLILQELLDSRGT